MLTTGVDTFVGTDKNELITGTTSTLVAKNTLNQKDVIDGGEGSDIFKLNMESNNSAFTDGSIKNVEKIELTNDTVITRTFDAKNVTGATEYNINSAKGVNLTNLESTGIKVSQEGTQSNTSITYVSTLDLTGTTDAATLAFKDVGAAKTDSSTGFNQKTTLAKIEALSIESNGTANFVDLTNVDAATSVTVTGAADLTVSNVGKKLTSFDANAATGKVTVNTADVTAPGSISSIYTGSADDKITADAADLQANAIINGGAGADTLVLSDTATAGSTIQLQQSGVETLEISGVTTTKTLTASLSNTADVSMIKLNAKGAGTADGAVSIVNAGSSDYTVEINGGTAAGQALSIDSTAVVNVNVEATEKQATDAVKSTGSTTTSASAVTASAAENAIFTVGQYMTQSGKFIASKATSVTLNVDSGKNTATKPGELTSFKGALEAAKATSITVNATGELNGAKIDGDAATSAVINTGTTASSVILDIEKATDLQITALGDLAISTTGGTSLEKVQSATLATDGALSIADGTDTTVLSDIATLTISGTNAKSSFDNNAKALGIIGMDHSLTVNASGLKAGFNIDGDISSKAAVTITSSDVTGEQAIGNGTITTAITGSDVTLTSSGALKDVTYGLVEAAATDRSGTATVNAASNLGNVKVGTIGAANKFKTVNVDVTGTAGTVTVGAITADSVTVNAANTLKSVTIGQITAVTSVDLTAGLKSMNGTGAAVLVDIDNTLDKAFTATLNGSIELDKYTLATTKNVASNITVKGDLGLGDDTISISAATVTTSTNTVAIDISGLADYTSSTLTGGAGANTITGGEGADTIAGSDKADTIVGGAGDDIITGGGEADIITAGEGADIITGGLGADIINLTESTAKTDTVNIAASESIEGAMDSITGFAAIATNGDILNIANSNVAAIAATSITTITSETETGTLTASVSATGILTLNAAVDGEDAYINTLGEWIDVAELVYQSQTVADSTTLYNTFAFEFGGNTYVFQGKTVVDASSAETYATEAVVELVGVTGITGLSANAAANTIDIA